MRYVLVNEGTMKLKELRSLYTEGSKPEVAETIDVSAKRVFTGVDLAHGPNSSVAAIMCDRCDLVMNVVDKPNSTLCYAYCPRCDVRELRESGCAICHKTHDADGAKLRLRETGAEEKRVCDQCRYDYYDVLAGEFVSEKMR